MRNDTLNKLTAELCSINYFTQISGSPNPSDKFQRILRKADKVTWLNILSRISSITTDAINRCAIPVDIRGEIWRFLSHECNKACDKMRTGVIVDKIGARGGLAQEVLPIAWGEIVSKKLFEAEFKGIIQPVYFIDTFLPIFYSGKAPVGWKGIMPIEWRYEEHGLPVGEIVVYPED